MPTNSHPHSELIDEIGAAVLRSQFNLSHQRLHWWRKRGIPHGYRPAVAQLALVNGKPIPADFLAPPAEKVRAAA